MIYRAPIHAVMLYQQYRTDNMGKRPTKITMHPAVWARLLNSLEGAELGWVRRDIKNYYLLEMKVEESCDVPGIEMLIE